MRLSWLKRLAARSSSSPRARRLAPWRPGIEALEDRCLLSTFTVANLNDSGSGSLRQAVLDGNAHAGPDTIAFAPGLHGTITLTGGALEVTDAVAINGPGADKLAVSGNDVSRIFQLDPDISLTITGLTLTHGAASVGGAVLNDGGNLGLNADVLSSNRSFGDNGGDFTHDFAGARGGAIASGNGATLSVTGCTFADNLAASTAADGGARGGAIFCVDSTVTVSNSTFRNNQAIGARGATSGGGAIYNFVLSTLTVSGSTFVSNQGVGSDGAGQAAGYGQGGAMVNNGYYVPTGAFLGATMNVSTTVFLHNQAVGGNNGNAGSNFNSFVGLAFGGAIRNYVGTPT
jgi:hypothetical protein